MKVLRYKVYNENTRKWLTFTDIGKLKAYQSRYEFYKLKVYPVYEKPKLYEQLKLDI